MFGARSVHHRQQQKQRRQKNDNKFYWSDARIRPCSFALCAWNMIVWQCVRDGFSVVSLFRIVLFICSLARKKSTPHNFRLNFLFAFSQFVDWCTRKFPIRHKNSRSDNVIKLLSLCRQLCSRYFLSLFAVSNDDNIIGVIIAIEFSSFVSFLLVDEVNGWQKTLAELNWMKTIDTKSDDYFRLIFDFSSPIFLLLRHENLKAICVNVLLPNRTAGGATMKR